MKLQKFKNYRLLVSAMSAAFVCSASAAVSTEEAKQLGGSVLTAWGAEKAGNKDGTIPAYTGEPTPKPAGYNPKDPGQHPDPWNDKPLFSITAQNYTRYADKLDGMAEMFKRFPNFRMDVYPTRRSFVYPKWVLDNIAKNATACKAIDDELKLDGCYGGMPFPIPKTGKQVMWNHLTQFEAHDVESGATENYVIPVNGPAVMVGQSGGYFKYPFYDSAKTGPRPSNTILQKVRIVDHAPARMAGGGTLVIDSLDMVGAGRRAWLYVPGQRRVKLAPDLSYDTPSPYSGGGATMDDQKAFMGALDRYDFKLIGKKEKFIPENNYALFDRKACPTSKLTATKNFINPDCVRYELRRVWVVEATLKQGFRHIYKKRMFFWDEDTPGTGVAENYDASGQVYRIANAGGYPFYELPGSVGGLAGSMGWYADLTTGIASFTAMGGAPEPGSGWYPGPEQSDNFFSPEAMAGEGVR